MGGYSYSALEVVVTADTRGLTAQVRNAATKAGTEASSTINEHVGKGFKSLGPVVGKIGKAAATGLGLATTAAVAFGVKAFKAAAQVEAMNTSLAALARANHVSYAAMQNQISALQRQGVEVEDAQKFVANLTRAHVNLANATKLGTIAQNASIVTGKSFADVSGAITKAIATGNAAALKRAGLYVDSKKALADYAAQIGKTTDELTSQEKQQAILNAVTKTGQTIQGAFAAQLKTPTGALLRDAVPQAVRTRAGAAAAAIRRADGTRRRGLSLRIARHPATAAHVAHKLARHFIADDPALVLIERLAKCFRDTEGDLKEMAKALVASPEAWATPRSKLKRPTEWIVAALRATGASVPDIPPVLQAQNLLGEPLWRPPAPNGFADDDATWLDGLSQRLDVANQIALRIAPAADPNAVFEETLAPIASAETRRTIARAESRSQALALLLMAPEFQRR